jgi:hypothetical protein
MYITGEEVHLDGDGPTPLASELDMTQMSQPYTEHHCEQIVTEDDRDDKYSLPVNRGVLG